MYVYICILASGPLSRPYYTFNKFSSRVPSAGRITLLAARERPFRLGIHFFDFQMSAPPMNIFRRTNVIERVQLSLPARKLLRWCLQCRWKGKKVKSKGKNHVCSHLYRCIHFFFFFFLISTCFFFSSIEKFRRNRSN